jgi:hypothetical protein
MAQIKDSVRDHDADDRGPNSTQIRREIERTRAEMDNTFDALESKLTPSQLLGEAWSLTKGGSTAGASKLWQIARQYPLPSAVIGLGLGWLLVESSRSEDSGREYRSRGRRGYRNYGRESYGYNTGYRTSADYAGSRYGATGFETEYDNESDYGFDADYESGEGRMSRAKHAVGGAAHSAKDAVSGAASSAKDAVSGAAHTVKDTVSDAAHSVRDAASGARHKVSSAAERARYEARMKSRQARTGFWQQMESNPLVMGAATLALGLIAGLSIPSTRKEDELMGETRDRLMEDVKERGQEVLEKGKQVANVAVDTVKQVAQDQGLTPDSVVGNVADKVRAVGREAKNAVKDEVKKQDLLPNTQGGNQQGGNQENQNQGQSFGENRTPGSNLGDGMAGTGLGSTLGTGSNLNSGSSLNTGSNLGTGSSLNTGSNLGGGSNTPSPTVGGTPGATMGGAAGTAKGGRKAATDPNQEENKVTDNEPELSRR